MSYKIDWNGDELLKVLREGEPEAMFEAGLVILESAKGRINDVSGRLKESGYVSTTTKSTYVKKKWNWRERKSYNPFAVVVAFAARTAHLVEYGTKKMSAKPFLRPALDEAKQAAGEAFTVKMSKTLEAKLKKAK